MPPVRTRRLPSAFLWLCVPLVALSVVVVVVLLVLPLVSGSRSGSRRFAVIRRGTVTATGSPPAPGRNLSPSTGDNDDPGDYYDVGANATVTSPSEVFATMTVDVDVALPLRSKLRLGRSVASVRP
ncbi:hypothetical protein IscW_ISCW006199 [Ixodes scapularis]|uniref:Uncharacterized protein n=1 Tax=Ixodes scapularis TaxID=6945 RepID=B7PKL3_IXOSC|nr:hypothetical protein IscW_ISCW006199 [Ixodes scapularis]|eukprot:XP_002400712.1 hypothetical protein IscW_ISCW006199 [Ixodes scapularis]